MRLGPSWPCLLLGFIFCTVGCWKPTDRLPVYPVTGKVTYRGKPAANAFVAFHPVENNIGEKVSISGRADEAGVFKLTTYDAYDGAPAGQYVVTILWPARVDDIDDGPDQLNGRYATQAKSPLRATVNQSATQIPPFELGR